MAQPPLPSPSPAKRQRTHPPPSTSDPIDPSLSTSTSSSSPSPRHLTPKEREQLRVVVLSLAPTLVLEQSLSVDSVRGQTLREVLASEQSVPLDVLRACINESSTSALLASTMMMGFGGGAHGADGGEAESASLLNEIDEFQRTVLGVVGELERRVGGDGENEQKPQQEQGRTVQKYMLHRSLTTGVDLFTSAAMLGEADLAELGGIEDTDLISVLPPLPLPLPLSSSSSNPLPSPPPLGLSSPRPSLPSSLLAPALPAASTPVKLLDYGAYSSFAPAFDSTGATEGYERSAGEALRRSRVRRWEAAVEASPAVLALPSPPAAETAAARGEGLSEQARATLRELGIEDVDKFEKGLRRVEEGERENWRVLEGVSRLIERVGGRQVVRISGSGREGGERTDEKTGRAEGVKKEEDGDEEEKVEGVRVEGAEKEEAALLLRTLSNLIASHPSQPSSSSLPSPATASSSPTSAPSDTAANLLPPSQLLGKLAPLLMASQAREPSYWGTLEKGGERGVREGGFAQSQTALGGLGVGGVGMEQ